MTAQRLRRPRHLVGITPYVGAGVGFAYNKLFGLTDTGYAFTGRRRLSPTGGYSDDGGKRNFAWALMAGLSFNVTQNLKLDLGYRYLDSASSPPARRTACRPRTISTESSHKYTGREIAKLAASCGFGAEAPWVDDEWPFAENLLLAV